MTALPGQSSHPIRRRLWKGAGLCLAFVLTIIIGNFFIPADRAVTRQMLGHDFLPFYAAGTFARTGRFDRLYDLTSIKAMETTVAHSAGLTDGFGPWWNPPFAAWLFAPFSLATFSHALLAWEITGWLMLIASIVLLDRMIPDHRNWRNWGLLIILILASNPVWSVTTHAQNSFLTLLLLTISVTFWRSRRPFAAGLTAALLLYKPQHAVIFCMVMCLSLGWRAAAGMLVTTLSLIAITLITMPGALGDYVHKLPRLLLVMQELSPYAWDRHVTLKAFWRMLLQGTNPGPTTWTTWSLWWTCELFVALSLLRVILQTRRDRSNLDRLIAMTILSGPLLMTFFFDYDLMILAIPAVLCAADMMRRRFDRRLLGTWCVIYILLHLSTPQARATHVILITPALFILAALMARPPRREISESQIAPAQIQPALAA
jgi:hypothetical protein